MRPAIADIIVSPAQVSVTIRFNAELFLADIDASTIKDSDDAPNAAAYDRIRQLSPVALGNEFAKRWPAFADHLNVKGFFCKRIFIICIANKPKQKDGNQQR